MSTQAHYSSVTSATSCS